ncbi:MAG: hypothetical protein J2P54_09275 [Bradyrhizobiaceae bacterium]|nr:hypothetical protein [Bradyrhizobiaceae bacterium]
MFNLFGTWNDLCHGGDSCWTTFFYTTVLILSLIPVIIPIISRAIFRFTGREWPITSGVPALLFPPFQDGTDQHDQYGTDQNDDHPPDRQTGRP